MPRDPPRHKCSSESLPAWPSMDDSTTRGNMHHVPLFPLYFSILKEDGLSPVAMLHDMVRKPREKGCERDETYSDNGTFRGNRYHVPLFPPYFPLFPMISHGWGTRPLGCVISTHIATCLQRQSP
jgi:hypothetical protein